MNLKLLISNRLTNLKHKQRTVHLHLKCGIDRLPKIIAETGIKDWYDRLNSYGMANPSDAPASQSGHLHARRA
jgi:hypothetical protein